MTVEVGSLKRSKQPINALDSSSTRLFSSPSNNIDGNRSVGYNSTLHSGLKRKLDNSRGAISLLNSDSDEESTDDDLAIPRKRLISNKKKTRLGDDSDESVEVDIDEDLYSNDDYREQYTRYKSSRKKKRLELSEETKQAQIQEKLRRIELKKLKFFDDDENKDSKNECVI